MLKALFDVEDPGDGGDPKSRHYGQSQEFKDAVRRLYGLNAPERKHLARTETRWNTGGFDPCDGL